MSVNQDIKQFATWALGFLMTCLLGLACYVGNRIVEGQDKINDTLTTILVQQRDLDRRLTVVEASTSEHVKEDAERWKAHDQFQRTFFQDYDLVKKK